MRARTPIRIKKSNNLWLEESVINLHLPGLCLWLRWSFVGPPLTFHSRLGLQIRSAELHLGEVHIHHRPLKSNGARAVACVTGRCRASLCFGAPGPKAFAPRPLGWFPVFRSDRKVTAEMDTHETHGKNRLKNLRNWMPGFSLPPSASSSPRNNTKSMSCSDRLIPLNTNRGKCNIFLTKWKLAQMRQKVSQRQHLNGSQLASQ